MSDLTKLEFLFHFDTARCNIQVINITKPINM